MPFHYLHSHQTFLSVAAMDFAVAEHPARHELTTFERAVLLRIAQSALKYPGAAHLKASTIAQSVAVSTKTVYRAVKRLQALGILCILPGTNLNGRKHKPPRVPYHFTTGSRFAHEKKHTTKCHVLAG